MNQDWYGTNNSDYISLGNENGSTAFGVRNSVSEQNIHLEVSQSDSFCNSDHKPIAEDPTSEEIHSTSSNSNAEMLLDARKTSTSWSLHNLM